MTILTAVSLWLLLPACGIGWLYTIVGPDPRLLYLAAVTILPGGLALAAPLLRVGMRQAVQKQQTQAVVLPDVEVIHRQLTSGNVVEL